MEPDFAKCFFAAALVIGLAACTSAPVTRKDEASVLRMLPVLDKHNSVLLVRVRYDGYDCSGFVRLRRISNGRIDTMSQVYVGNANWGRSAREMPSFGRHLKNLVSLDFAEINKQGSLYSLRSKLVTVAPGDYIVSFAECAVNGKRTWLGQDKSTSPWGATDNPLPVSGANFIHIPEGKVVDAGYLEIKTVQRGFLFIDGKGILMAYGASDGDRQSLRSNFPDLYAKMTFTNFSTYPGFPPR